MHALIGFAVYNVKMLSKIYLFVIFIFFVLKIIKSRPSQVPVNVLSACAYMVGVEVFLRMTGGNIVYETSKYLVICFIMLGVFMFRASKAAMPYILYLFLLVPGIVIVGLGVTEGATLRKDIAFNLSGPLCLGVVAIFSYKLKISYQNVQKILLHIGLPLVVTASYLFFYNPNVQEIVTSTGSNFAASGGFGPNQVATVLGLGMFVFSVRFFMLSPSLFLKLLNGIVLAVLSFRGIVTFSRGGIITALFMIITFIYFYFKRVNRKTKARIGRFTIVFSALALVIWLFSLVQTNGLIENRYVNRDAIGRNKADITTGRSALVAFELKEFYKNPVFGVGVGKVKALRAESEGVVVASHNEISRILSEHGLFGAVAILILLLVPLFFRLKNRSNIFFYSCYIFWFLTINHSSMRIAAPAFLYGLSLLDIQYKTKSTIKARQKKVKIA